MEWDPHYTGIEIAVMEWHRFVLYMQRSTKTKKMQMVRFSWPRHMVGLFIGRSNFVQGYGGWELFTRGHHMGWARNTGRRKLFRTDWSGSSVDPYHSFTWRVARFGIGGRTPHWAKRMKDRREARKWEEYAANAPDDGQEWSGEDEA